VESGIDVSGKPERWQWFVRDVWQRDTPSPRRPGAPSPVFSEADPAVSGAASARSLKSRRGPLERTPLISPRKRGVHHVNDGAVLTSGAAVIFTLSSTSTTSASSQIARRQRSSPSRRPHSSPRRLHVNDSNRQRRRRRLYPGGDKGHSLKPSRAAQRGELSCAFTTGEEPTGPPAAAEARSPYARGGSCVVGVRREQPLSRRDEELMVTAALLRYVRSRPSASASHCGCGERGAELLFDCFELRRTGQPLGLGFAAAQRALQDACRESVELLVQVVQHLPPVGVLALE